MPLVKLIELAPCDADLMVADALTKGLPTPEFLKHKVEMLGIAGMGTEVPCVGGEAYSLCPNASPREYS